MERLGPETSYKFTDGLTESEDHQLTDLLRKWNGGRLSTPVFTELAKKIPQPIVEVVIFQDNKGVLETLLLPRPEDDITWPGMLHTPGTTLRLSDYKQPEMTPNESALKRIQDKEIHHNFSNQPLLVGNFQRMSERGPEFGSVYIAEIENGVQLKPGLLWCPVNQLFENPQFIQHQLQHIKIAVEVYTTQHKKA